MSNDTITAIGRTIIVLSLIASATYLIATGHDGNLTHVLLGIALGYGAVEIPSPWQYLTKRKDGQTR